MKTYKTLIRGNIKSNRKTNNQFMGNHRISISNELLLINGRFCLPRITVQLTTDRQTDRQELIRIIFLYPDPTPSVLT